MTMPTTTKTTSRFAIMLAWVEQTGLRATGGLVLRDANWFPEHESCPEAKVCAWLWNGTKTDVAKAREYAESQGYKVFVYPASEADPKGRARADVMAGNI
jgi:hypothetical protein